MRCDAVLRALNVPAGGLDPGAIADHLDACPACAREADRVRRLDLAWAATTPRTPPDEEWDRVWAAASAGPASIPTTFGLRRSRWIALAGLAQAAAVVGAGVALLRRPAEAPNPPADPPVVARRDEATPGSTLFICLDADGRRVDPETRLATPGQLGLADAEDPISPAWDMELINSFEGAE